MISEFRQGTKIARFKFVYNIFYVNNCLIDEGLNNGLAARYALTLHVIPAPQHKKLDAA